MTKKEEIKHCKKCGCIVEKTPTGFGKDVYTHKFFSFAQASHWCSDHVCEIKEELKK